MSNVHFFRLKFLLCILAAGNLVLLFLFEYKLPFLSSHTEGQETPVVSGTPGSGNSADTVQILFEPDTLTYDGTDVFNPLSGVSLVNPDGNGTKNDLFVSIQSGTETETKKITYTLKENDRNYSAERTLRLINYSGPSITVPTQTPTISDEAEIYTIADKLISLGEITAQDGYGNDISDAIQIKCVPDEQDMTLYHCQFTVTNLFQDICRKDLDISLNTDAPILRLSASEITIAVGEVFYPLNYVAAAEDSDGNSLYNHISVKGTVDSSIPGKYELKYYAVDREGRQSAIKTLSVTVE